MVDLSDVYSVTSAIDRGVISKGSFLAAYILGTPPACAIHVLDQGLKLDYDIVVDSLNHTIGSLTFASSAPSLIPSKDSNRPTGWRWQELPFLPLNLNNCRSVWLDVDLDAFCNRYDGDSDRAALLGTESERAMLLQGMDAFLDRLSKASWRSQINAVSIAASPGFFPSEYWDEAIPKITDGLTNLLSAAP
jgi:hypothetical protein